MIKNYIPQTESQKQYRAMEKRNNEQFRLLCKQNLNIGDYTLHISRSRYSNYDATLTNNKTGRINSIIEFKNRTKKYSSHLLEVEKYYNLKVDREVNQIRNIYYVIFNGEDECLIFNLTEMKMPPIEQIKCRKSTANDRGETLKDVFFLDEKYAKKYKKIKRKWQLQLLN